MQHTTPRSPWRTVTLLAAAFLVLAAAAVAENRLPANRTYLASVQGLDADPHATEFACIVFHRDGRLVAGEDTGVWAIDDRLTTSRHQTAIVFAIGAENDDGTPVEIEGRCWLESLGPINSLSCSAYGSGEGVAANFALTARPLGGETRPEALAHCQAKADLYNQ